MRNGKTKKIEFVQYTITTERKIGYRLMLDSVNHLGHSVFNDKVNNIEIQFAELNFKKSEQLIVCKEECTVVIVRHICLQQL